MDHLLMAAVPSIELPSTGGGLVNLSQRSATITVLYCYPRTSSPVVPTPVNWKTIPGAKGCTLQTCAFRDNHGKLLEFGAELFGLSSQDTEYQKEMVTRLHVPYEVLSDAGLSFSGALGLPKFNVEGIELIRRITLVISRAHVVKIFYPVAQPEQNFSEVLDWLKETS